MNEKKLTDEEIVKALECCEDDENVNCGDCPLVRESCAVIRKYALDLIHRLQDENATLKAELKKELVEHEEFTKKAKAEIERLTEELKYYRGELQ